jgi:hypothetical protein
MGFFQTETMVSDLQRLSARGVLGEAGFSL